MAKVYALASKKGLPKFSMNFNQLSSYEADDIQDFAYEVQVGELAHHRRNLYGKGTPRVLKHGDKPLTKDRKYSTYEDKFGKDNE
jgi:hypothetical protein